MSRIGKNPIAIPAGDRPDRRPEHHREGPQGRALHPTPSVGSPSRSPGRRQHCGDLTQRRRAAAVPLHGLNRSLRVNNPSSASPRLHQQDGNLRVGYRVQAKGKDPSSRSVTAIPCRSRLPKASLLRRRDAWFSVSWVSTSRKSARSRRSSPPASPALQGQGYSMRVSRSVARSEKTGKVSHE